MAVKTEREILTVESFSAAVKLSRTNVPSYLLHLLDHSMLYVDVFKDRLDHHVHILEVFVRQRWVKQRHCMKRCISSKQINVNVIRSYTQATAYKYTQWILTYLLTHSPLHLTSEGHSNLYDQRSMLANRVTEVDGLDPRSPCAQCWVLPVHGKGFDQQMWSTCSKCTHIICFLHSPVHTLTNCSSLTYSFSALTRNVDWITWRASRL